MALGVNIQWGYAGLFNVGIMGFSAVGGVATVIVAKEPVIEAWQVGGGGILMAGLLLVITVFSCLLINKKLSEHKQKKWFLGCVIVVGFLLAQYFYHDASLAIESVNPSKTGYLGGLGMPILFSWIVGALVAASIAWLIGKITLGLRSDYLAIATLGISEIIVSIVKNEDWLTRGVKNVTAIPRPVPYEIELQEDQWFIGLVKYLYQQTINAVPFAEQPDVLQSLVINVANITVKLGYTFLFATILIIIFWLMNRAINSPWGRMMRAIRDNETAATAMGKDVFKRHMQVFILGSAIIGMAGAMLTTLDGQLTPNSYHPLRYTFLIWVMVIVGGSGNNFGSIIGAFIIWFTWIMSESVGVWLIELLTSNLADSDSLKLHLLETAQHMRLLILGLVLVLVIRFRPGGLFPEQQKQHIVTPLH